MSSYVKGKSHCGTCGRKFQAKNEVHTHEDASSHLRHPAPPSGALDDYIRVRVSHELKTAVKYYHGHLSRIARQAMEDFLILAQNGGSSSSESES